MKISQVCKMIEDSIHAGKYQLDYQQKHFKDSPCCITSKQKLNKIGHVSFMCDEKK